MRIDVLEKRPDGSGRIRMPVLMEGVTIDLSRTASRVNGKLTITREMMLEMVQNGWPGPRPIHRSPHRQYEETAGPGDGFIDNLEYQDGVLLGTFDLTAPLFAEVVGRQWRGFSADMFLNRKLPTGDIKGWAMHGGVFTNRPSLPIDAVVAASQNLQFEESATVYVDLAEAPGKEPVMSDELAVRLATVEAEKKTLADQNASLEARLKETRDDKEKAYLALEESNRRLDAALGETATAKVLADRREREAKDAEDEAKRLRAEKVSLSAKISDLEVKTLRDEVTKIVRKGISAGIPPSLFDGYEADSVKWFQSKFVSLEALDAFVSQLPKTVKLSAPHTSKGADNSTALEELDPDRVKNLHALNLNPKFVSVQTSDDLAALREAGQLEKSGRK